jgi:hypothetical protein
MRTFKYDKELHTLNHYQERFETEGVYTEEIV